MRTVLMAAAAAAFLAPAALADSVSMPDKMELSGKKIQILEIRDDSVLVRVAYGDIVIPKSRVTAMKVDFTERLTQLKEQGGDTPRALFALGRVCSQLEMPKEAATAFREAFDRKDVPEDLLLPLAGELEKCEDWAGAQKCYGACLKLHPDNADVAAKAQNAANKAAAAVPTIEAPVPADVKIDSTGAARATAKPARPEQPAGVPAQPEGGQPAAKEAEPEQPGAAKEQEGLESVAGWSTEAWGSSVEINIGAPQGGTDKMLRVFLAGAEQEKACVMLEQDFDLSDKKALTFDVYNFAKQSISLAVAFTTAPGWKFYESMPVVVTPTGDTPRPVTIDLTSDRFKSAETQWRHKSKIEGARRVVKLYFLLYTRQTGAWVLFNKIRIEAADGAPAAGPAAAPAPAAPQPKPAPVPKAAPAPAPGAEGPAAEPAPAPQPKAEPAAPAPAPAAPKAPAEAAPAPAPKP